MNKEEKEAIERFSKAFEYLNVWNKELIVVPEDKKYFLTVLNLLEKKDKIIDEMVDFIDEIDGCLCFDLETRNCIDKNCKECIKQYFEKKVEG